MANQNNQFDPLGMMKDWQLPNMDSEAMVNYHRKNAELFTNAMRSSMETIRNLSQMQMQFATQWMETLRHASQQMAAPGKWEDKLMQSSEIVKQNVHNAMHYMKQASAAVADNSYKALDTMADRVAESMDEAITFIRKAQPATAKK